jgi:hypothetical protein
MSGPRFKQVSRTDLNTVTVITAHDTDGAVPPGKIEVWTLISSADGHDVVITPGGTHLNVDSSHTPGDAAEFVDWVVNDLIP